MRALGSPSFELRALTCATLALGLWVTPVSAGAQPNDDFGAQPWRDDPENPDAPLMQATDEDDHPTRPLRPKPETPDVEWVERVEPTPDLTEFNLAVAKELDDEGSIYGFGGQAFLGPRGHATLVGQDARGTVAGEFGINTAFSVNLFTMRLRFESWIGGGDADLDGRTSGTLTAGVIGQLSEVGGIFLRGGLDIESLSNQSFELMLVHLPRFELGYQMHTKSALLELGPRGGLTLGGRVLTLERSEAVSALRQTGVDGVRPDFGLGLLLYTDDVFIDASLTRVQQPDPIHVGAARACVDVFVMICADGRVISGSTVDLRGRDVPVTGFMLGGGVGFGGSGASGTGAGAALARQTRH